MIERLFGLVLCGGRSSRMGKDKSQLVRPDGRTQLVATYDCLRACVDRVALSVGNQRRSEVDPAIPQLLDSVSDHGPCGGVLAGLQWAGQHHARGLLTVAVDHPLLTPAGLRPLLEAWQRQPTVLHVAADAQARLQPTLAIWPLSLERSLSAWISSGNDSLYRLMQSLGCVAVALDASVTFSANTHDEWEEAWKQPGTIQ